MPAASAARPALAHSVSGARPPQGRCACCSGANSSSALLRHTRALLRREEDSMGDTSTLADPAVVQTLLSLRGK